MRLVQHRAPAALLVALTLTATAACADGGATGSGGGAGVDVGATKKDYQEAMSDLDEITLRTQSPAPQGSASGRPFEAYYEAVEEWSGGKVTFDVAYSNAVAGPTEADDALNDGRLDLAVVLPVYEPSDYPSINALIDAGFVSDQSAVPGTLSSNAWPNQVAFENDAIMREFDDHGLVPLVPIYHSGANGLFCTDERNSLADLDGTSVGVTTSAQAVEVEALGASPSSVPFTEMFESLERGVIDCIVNSPNVAVLGGLTETAPYAVIDPEVGFNVGSGSLAFSRATWETLPLVVQQLLWDKLDVYLELNLTEKTFANNAAMAAAVTEAGGGVSNFATDAREALRQANEEILDDTRDAEGVDDANGLVDAVVEANGVWVARVAELGLGDPAWDDVDDWWADGGSSTELAAFTDVLMETVFEEHRPS